MEWTPREQNVEADTLTNSDFLAFDPGKRIAVDLKSLNFRVLDRLMGEAEIMYDQLALDKERSVVAPRPAVVSGRKRGRAGRLKEVDPW